MAKKKAKVRTTAQRRAAAKAAWAIRKLRGATTPTPVAKGHKSPAIPAVDFVQAQTPTTAAATMEGTELFVTISTGSSIHRHKLSHDTMRKLALDCLHLVG